jgi:hypothetical protein
MLSTVHTSILGLEYFRAEGTDIYSFICKCTTAVRIYILINVLLLTFSVKTEIHHTLTYILPDYLLFCNMCNTVNSVCVTFIFE